MNNAANINHLLSEATNEHTTVKWYATIDINFTRTTPDGQHQETSARFRTTPQIFSHEDALNIDNIASEFSSAIDNFNKLGSNWIIHSIRHFSLTFAPYRPTQGSNFIPTPLQIRRKKAVINVQNEDNLCFLYSILAAIYPVDFKRGAHRAHHYRRHLKELVTNDLSFPMKVRDVPKFENLNEQISVSVFVYEDRQLIPLYSSPHRNRQHTIHLLLLSDGEKRHYTLIKNMSRLVAGRTNHRGVTHVCPYCIHCFRYKHTLDKHIPHCSIHNPQVITFPEEEDATLSYKDIQKEFPVPYVIYVDFESFLTPSSDKNSINEHVPSGFCCLKVSKFDGEIFEPYVYSGENVMSKFYEYIYAEQQTICEKLNIQKDMIPLTEQEKIYYENATTCPNCNNNFDQNSRIKVRHHCHTTGRFLDAVCSKCNLQLKYRKRKRPGSIEDECFIPVIAHNMKGYDSHLILKHYEQHQSRKSSISVIPSNTEKFIAFQIGKLRFLDSLQFLNASLNRLVDTLSADAFKFTSKFTPSPDLARQKGVYPYEYVTDPSKFTETRLPPKDKFYSALNETDITDEDYDRAQQIWNIFNCRTLRDYHNAYLMMDVLLLADVFENFREMCLKNYRLDPAHFYTTPGLSFQACLKMTGVKLDLFTDPDKHLFIENNIKGGVSVVTNRYAKANNNYSEDGLDETQPTSYICYLDANNLYGYAMSQPLPTSNFRFLSEDEICNLDISNIPDDNSLGYILEVDLEYPQELHKLHNDYPLAPEKVLLTKEMLSPYSKSFPGKHFLTEKLIPNLHDKTKYVTHYVNLKLYIRLGMKLKRVHRVMEFRQSTWMKPYIDFNTEKRRQATTDFERDFYKLLNNSVFGKTMENLRNRINVSLCDNETKAKKMIASPTFKHTEIINENLVMIHRTPPKIKLNKPIYIGFSILELSKAHMYRFHYDVVLAKYGLNCRLLFTDTDSFCYHVTTDDLYRDMMTFADILDTSSYPKDSECDALASLYSPRNAKVLGKFKDECNGTAPMEFVGLRSKMYSLLVSRQQTKMTAKGVKKSFIEKHINHEMFLHTLKNKTCTTAQYLSFRSHNHTINTIKNSKISLSSYDDKRYILIDGVNSLAYGHCDINMQTLEN